MTSSEIITLDGQPISYQTSDDELDARQPHAISGHVTMSRALAESAHGLTLNEARVMMLAMRCVNPRSSPYQYAKATSYVKVQVHAADFAKIGQISRNPDQKNVIIDNHVAINLAIAAILIVVGTITVFFW